MVDIKATLIPALIELLVEGCKDRPIEISTTHFGKKIGKSQQAVSKYLRELEEEGYIERSRKGNTTLIRITNRGTRCLEDIYSTLKSMFEEKPRIYELKGRLFTGIGEGAYYISLNGYKTQFQAKLGFEPYPGTVNLKLTNPVDRKFRRDLEIEPGIMIEGFKNGKRTYGGAKCFKAVINDKIEAAVLVIERTHYDDSVLEVIAPVNVRRELDLKEDDVASVRVSLPSNRRPQSS